jgi:hypothetical protein
MNKNTLRGILIPTFAVLLSAFNLMCIQKSDNVRPVNFLTILVMGFALGILVMNLITLYKNKNQ